MKDELREKLNRLLEGRTTFTEAEAVYFLVESRKLLDRQRQDGDDRFQLVRFYADWSVHTAKDRNLGSIRNIAERIASAPRAELSVKGVASEQMRSRLDFMYMTSLREEIRAYLQHFDIADPFADDAPWIAFVVSLTAVLQDQPITRPHPDIVEIRYEPAVPGAAILAVTFRDERGTERYGNYF